MVPKFTMKLDLATNTNEEGDRQEEKTDSYVLDVDYTNLKRI